jgi:hypothetical protein
VRTGKAKVKAERQKDRGEILRFAQDDNLKQRPQNFAQGGEALHYAERVTGGR